MYNIKLIIEYNGAKFHGWQYQPNLRTIQEELEKALSIALRSKISGIVASGRTDCGVHAKGQVVNFFTSEMPDLHRLQVSISSLLKNEVSVLSAEVVDNDFHATKDAKKKQYVYTILNRNTTPTMDYGFVWHVPYKLDLEKMQTSASEIIGVHDFTSFRASGCTASTPVKEIFESEVIKNGDYVIYRVIGKGFLKQMVRNIVGTLVEIGSGQRQSSIKEILDAKNRIQAGQTAPAHGLYLDWVKYD